MSTCPVCHSSSVLSHNELHECLVCSHMYQWPLKATAQYDSKYVQDRYDKYPTTEPMSYLRLGLVQGHLTSGRLLDVGYGNGTFVKLAAKAGFDAFGNDVHGADYGVREATLTDGYWDVVTFFDSLEHFEDLQLIRDLLQRTRYVVLSVPARPLSFPKERAWRHYRPGEHLHYFSFQSLSKLLDRKLLALNSMEDIIRGRLPSGEVNINTYVFKA